MGADASEPLACHVAGSVVPSFQTLAITVVGDVPLTTSRTSSLAPAVTVRPATVTGPAMVAWPAPSTRSRLSAADPLGLTLTEAR